MKENDRATWLATLLMPDDVRTASTILWALSSELAAIPARINEPMAGEIRFQWWADALGGLRGDEAQANPLSRAVLTLVAAAKLPVPPLVDMVQARIADLYGDGIADRHAFEAYSGEALSAIFQLICVAVLGDRAKSCSMASGHAGVASCIADVLLESTDLAPSKRIRVPEDLLTACGTDQETFAASDLGARRSVIEALASYGREHLSAYREAIQEVPTEVRSVYLPLVRSAQVIEAAGRAPDKPTRPPSSIKLQWQLWRASRRGFS
ncbi:MAG: squalene/phytoene synthase family protein [Pseudomonadota bacterium]